MKRLPKKGKEVIGYKKVRYEHGSGHAIVQLLIPADAERVQPQMWYGSLAHKCRASAAEVMLITDCDSNNVVFDVCRSFHDWSFEYRMGQGVVSDGYSPSQLYDCAPGIHFFLTLEEAERY